MDDDRNSGMSEALRLTRAGQLDEAFAVMQRSLGGAPSPPARRPRSPRRRRPPFAGSVGGAASSTSSASALTAKAGAGLPARLGGLLDNLPIGRPGGARAGAAEAAAAPGGEIRHLATPSRPARAATTSTSPPAYTGDAAAARRHAARRQAERRRLRRRHPDERPRRAARLPRRLPGAVRRGQPRRLLELVLPGRPARRRGRAVDHRRHHPAGHGRPRRRPRRGCSSPGSPPAAPWPR